MNEMIFISFPCSKRNIHFDGFSHCQLISSVITGRKSLEFLRHTFGRFRVNSWTIVTSRAPCFPSQALTLRCVRAVRIDPLPAQQRSQQSENSFTLKFRLFTFITEHKPRHKTPKTLIGIYLFPSSCSFPEVSELCPQPDRSIYYASFHLGFCWLQL